jgi:adenylate cyclase
MRGRRQRIVGLFAVALLATGIGVLAYATHLLRHTEQQAIDARYSIRGAQRPPSNIVLVQIDNATLQQLKHTEFPFPRRYDANVIDHLRRAGAVAIALDLEFTQQTDVRDDDALIEALERSHGKTVLAASQIGRGGRTGVLGGGSLLHELQARPAEDRLVLDSDGVVRRFARSVDDLNSLPVVTVEVARGRPVPASLFGGGTLPIDFVGRSESFKSISYAKVLKGEYPPNLFAGKIVFVGASAPILDDVHATATSGSHPMPGDEIAANATSTLLRGVPLDDAAGWVDVLLIVLLGTAVPLASLRLRGWRSLLTAVTLAAAFTV